MNGFDISNPYQLRTFYREAFEQVRNARTLGVAQASAIGVLGVITDGRAPVATPGGLASELAECRVAFEKIADSPSLESAIRIAGTYGEPEPLLGMLVGRRAAMRPSPLH